MKKTREANLTEVARRLLLQSFAPASVLTDAKGNILYVHGETGKYLRPAPGEATLNVIEMAHAGLQAALRSAFRGAAGKQAPLLSKELSINDGSGMRLVRLGVRPLPEADSGQNLMLVSFEDAVSPAATAKPARGKRGAASAEHTRVEELERELERVKDNLNAAVEEQQASNEELKSINEEMQSTNEELQSTNEELETSKEELQSVNEELLTVNHELQTKIEQMTAMQNDMRNLLDNVNLGIIFLDSDLVIRRFTRGATRVYRLVETDVGRPLGDIKSALQDENLLADAKAVLESLVPLEREIRTSSGGWCLVRVQPYRTVDNVIDGLVLTFADISERVEALVEQSKARQLAESIIDTVREPLLVLNGEMQVISASRSFYREFKVTPEATLGRPIYELGDHQWDIAGLRTLLETILPRDRSFEDYVVDHEFPNIGRRRLLLNARRVANPANEPQLILLAIEPISEEPAPSGA